MTDGYKVIADWIARWNVHFVEPTVFGTTDPQRIADIIDTFCQKELGAAVADYLFYEASIGIVCGVRLVDNRRIVVKIHQPSRSLDFLESVVRVQHYLIGHGYPCTRPILAPRPLAYSIATTEELVDEGVYHQAYDPPIRRSMAAILAWLIQLTWTPEAIPGLQPAILDQRLPPGVTWPTPHSKLFDFEATTDGAEWIDEIARRAQEIKLHGAGRVVLGHTDWGVKHFVMLMNVCASFMIGIALYWRKSQLSLALHLATSPTPSFLVTPGFLQMRKRRRSLPNTKPHVASRLHLKNCRRWKLLESMDSPTVLVVSTLYI